MTVEEKPGSWQFTIKTLLLATLFVALALVLVKERSSSARNAEKAMMSKVQAEMQKNLSELYQAEAMMTLQQKQSAEREVESLKAKLESVNAELSMLKRKLDALKGKGK